MPAGYRAIEAGSASTPSPACSFHGLPRETRVNAIEFGKSCPPELDRGSPIESFGEEAPQWAPSQVA